MREDYRGANGLPGEDIHLDAPKSRQGIWLGRRAFLRTAFGVSGAMLLGACAPAAPPAPTAAPKPAATAAPAAPAAAKPTAAPAAAPTAAVAAKPVAWKFGTPVPPTHANAVAFKQVIDTIAQKTNGRIKIDLFPSGQLGSSIDMLDQLSKNTIQLDSENAPVLSQLSPKIGVYAAPFMFPDLKSVYKAVGSPTGQAFFDDLRTRRNIRVLTSWYNGSWHFLTNKRAVTKADDLKGMKLRIPVSPVIQTFMEELGASPVPMAFSEVYLSLQTGVVDGLPITLPSIEAGKLYEATKYFTLAYMLVDVVDVIVNEDAWKALSPDDQKLIKDSFEAGRAVSDKLVLEAEDRVLKLMADRKLQIIEKPDIQSFVPAAEKTWGKFESDWGGKTEVQKLRDAGK